MSKRDSCPSHLEVNINKSQECLEESNRFTPTRQILLALKQTWEGERIDGLPTVAVTNTTIVHTPGSSISAPLYCNFNKAESRHIFDCCSTKTFVVQFSTSVFLADDRFREFPRTRLLKEVRGKEQSSKQERVCKCVWYCEVQTEAIRRIIHIRLTVRQEEERW